MRCVSKCFVGGRSFRLYSLLFLGVIFGFSLSTIIHTFDVESLRSSAGFNVQSPLTRHHHRDASRVAFSNLNSKETLEERGEEPGDYGWDREPEASSLKRVTEPGEGRPPVPSVANSPVQASSETKMRMSRGEDVGGLQVDRLCDELATRHTLLVAVVTSVTQLMTQTLAIQGTWAPHTAHVVYFVGEVDVMPHLPQGMAVVKLEGVEDQENWDLKEISTIKYLIDRYLEVADWFMLIGDQTYLVTEHLENRLNRLDPRSPVYMGVAGEASPNGKSLLCRRHPGVVYSRATLEGLRAYLPMCWPGGEGEENSLGGCVAAMGLKCTRAKEMRELFLADAKLLVESPSLFSHSALSRALAIHPVQYPKYMYRLHSYYQEVLYNTSMERAKVAEASIQSTQPFIPSHLRSPFIPHPQTAPPTASAPPTSAATPQSTQPPVVKPEGGVVIRPRHAAKNKFELNTWEYFNQTRLMCIMNEIPARGIIGGIREEARFALTKAIYQANQGRPQAQRYVFDKLENGYHRVDPMRGSEFILDFVFRKASDRSSRIKRRLSILRPFHEAVVPVEISETLPTVNFLVTLSGLSNRLEHFLANYERNVLQLGEDATLTIVLFESPDAPKVRMMVQQYLTRYQGAQVTVVDIQGEEFARGVGLHYGLSRFGKDQLVFIVDVDLDISTAFLQRCRLNTVQGKAVYFPVFFKLYNQDLVNRYHRTNHSLLISRHRGHWAHYSYGMVCMYAGDYHRSGGFDVSMHGWGEEDVDLLNKVLKSGLEVFRAPDPGLIHNWHSKTCNKDKMTHGSAYDHCLQSKGENLADRIELAQYVFENELKKGNVL